MSRGEQAAGALSKGDARGSLEDTLGLGAAVSRRGVRRVPKLRGATGAWLS
jgi:hypothetical protein